MSVRARDSWKGTSRPATTVCLHCNVAILLRTQRFSPSRVEKVYVTEVRILGMLGCRVCRALDVPDAPRIDYMEGARSPHKALFARNSSNHQWEPSGQACRWHYRLGKEVMM